MTAPVAPATAVSPWTVTLAWTPEQNGGAVSAFCGRTPVTAIVGLLRAGETYEVVSAEYGLPVEGVAVLALLANEFAEQT